MKFNVTGVVIEVEAGCGGILRDDKEVAYAMFFGMIEVSGLGMAEEEPQKQPGCWIGAIDRGCCEICALVLTV
ncbi:hypothetical protein Gohar_027621, partial [Gossypium harknessii]|nr:hypothetical protein [Gossypium harknessii]